MERTREKGRKIELNDLLSYKMNRNAKPDSDLTMEHELANQLHLERVTLSAWIQYLPTTLSKDKREQRQNKENQ